MTSPATDCKYLSARCTHGNTIHEYGPEFVVLHRRSSMISTVARGCREITSVRGAHTIPTVTRDCREIMPHNFYSHTGLPRNHVGSRGATQFLQPHGTVEKSCHTISTVTRDCREITSFRGVPHNSYSHTGLSRNHATQFLQSHGTVEKSRRFEGATQLLQSHGTVEKSCYSIPTVTRDCREIMWAESRSQFPQTHGSVEKFMSYRGSCPYGSGRVRCGWTWWHTPQGRAAR